VNRAQRFLLLCIGALYTVHDAQAYVPGKFYFVGKTQEKVIALTFDDGPGRITPDLLKLLKDHDIRATFFMEGTQIEEYPKIARQVLEEGHEIGNHTYIHFDYHKVKNAAPERLVHELDQTESTLRRAFQDPEFRTWVVRMPYGYFNKTWLLPTLKKKGYALVHWSFDGEQDRSATPEMLSKAYIQHAKPGAVFLFHDGGRHKERILETVKIVIEELDKQGYEFVSAEEMFADPSDDPRP
jgi:chitin deacetylase